MMWRQGLKLSLNKVKPQIISLLDHAPKNFCFSSSPLRRDLCVFCREPGKREKRIPNGSLCGGESLSFVTKEQLKTKLSKSKKTFGSTCTEARLNNSWEYPPPPHEFFNELIYNLSWLEWQSTKNTRPTKLMISKNQIDKSYLKVNTLTIKGITKVLTIKKETNLVFSIYNRNECVAFRRYGLMSKNNNSDNIKKKLRFTRTSC